MEKQEARTIVEQVFCEGCESGYPESGIKHTPARKPTMPSAPGGRSIQRRRARAAGSGQLGRSDFCFFITWTWNSHSYNVPWERKEASCKNAYDDWICVDFPQNWSAMPWKLQMKRPANALRWGRGSRLSPFFCLLRTVDGALLVLAALPHLLEPYLFTSSFVVLLFCQNWIWCAIPRWIGLSHLCGFTIGRQVWAIHVHHGLHSSTEMAFPSFQSSSNPTTPIFMLP